MAVKKSTISASPAEPKSPRETIDHAERDLAAASAMLAALRSYVIAAGQATENDDTDQLACSLTTLLDVAVATVDRAQESVRALVGTGRKGGDE